MSTIRETRQDRGWSIRWPVLRFAPPIAAVAGLAIAVIAGGLLLTHLPGQVVGPPQTQTPPASVAPSSEPSGAPVTELLASIQTPEGIAGVYTEGEVSTGLYTNLVLDGHVVTYNRETGIRPSVHLLAYGGETAMTYNSFVFGLAPSGATMVELVGYDSASAVANGAYVLAVKAKDLAPAQLVWRFLSADGSIVDRGSGITQDAQHW